MWHSRVCPQERSRKGAGCPGSSVLGRGLTPDPRPTSVVATVRGEVLSTGSFGVGWVHHTSPATCTSLRGSV